MKKSNKKNLKNFKSNLSKKNKFAKIEALSLDVFSVTKKKISKFYSEFQKNREKENKRSIKRKKIEEKRQIIAQKKLNEAMLGTIIKNPNHSIISPK